MPPNVQSSRTNYKDNSINHYNNEQPKFQIWFEEDEWESFNTCAGDYDTELAYRNVRCIYNHHNSPYLTIAPLKEEILSIVPKISLFRQAVYDSEIDLLKFDAYNKVNLFLV